MNPRSKPRLNDLRHVQRRPGFADDYRGEEATSIPSTQFELEQLRSDTPEKAARFRAEPPKPVFTAANEDVLKSSLLIAHLELDRIRRAVQEQASKGLPASYDDMRLYLKLVDAVTKLTREARAQDDATRDAVSDLSDDDLMARAEAAKALLVRAPSAPAEGGPYRGGPTEGAAWSKTEGAAWSTTEDDDT